MCNLYTQSKSPDEIARLFREQQISLRFPEGIPNLQPRDIRITDPAPIVRPSPGPDGSFDLVLCVSTLEHVGRDNRVYGAADEADPDGIADALEELRRVVGGRLVVTVPCGTPEDHGWFVQLEPDAWNDAFLEADFSVLEEEIYALGPGGWRAAPDFDPTGVRYGDHASAVLCATLAPVSGTRRLARRARGAVARRGGGGTAPPTAPPPPGRAAG